MGWTIFRDSMGIKYAIGGDRVFTLTPHGWASWDIIATTATKFKRAYPKVYQLTPAEARALFKRVGSPDGKPIKPAKVRAKGFTDKQMLTYLIREAGIWLPDGEGGDMSITSRRQLQQAMRQAKKK